MVTSGTIEEWPSFNAEIDAHNIKKTLNEGIEKDVAVEDSTGQVLVQRSNRQRQEIKQNYQSLFNVGLCDDIANVVNKGNFFETVRALLLKPRDYDAECLHDAIVEGQESVICEMLCTRSSPELEDLLVSYQAEFESTVHEDLEEYIGNHRHIYLALLNSPRDSESAINDNLTADLVTKLCTAEKEKWDATKMNFVEILTSSNFTQLRAVFKEFQKREGGNMEMIEGSIRKSCKNEIINTCLVMWVKSIKNVTRLFSELLYQSVTSLTADSARVVRIIVGRSEIDLTQIKSHYMMQYNKQLKLAVQQKCGNDLAYSNIITMVIKN